MQTIGGDSMAPEEQMSDEQLLNKEEFYNQIMQMSVKASSAKNLRKFLGGIVLQIDAQGARLRVFAPPGSEREIIMDGMPVPFFFIDLDKLTLIGRFENMANTRSMAIRAQGSLGSIEIGENIPLAMHGSAMHKAGDDCPDMESDEETGVADMRTSLAGRSLGGITSPQ